MSIEWKTYFYPDESNVMRATLNSGDLAVACTRLGISESDLIEVTPSNDIKHEISDAYSIVSGVIEFDATVAKTSKKQLLRAVRKGLFKKTDSEYIRAIQQSNTTAQADLETKAEGLRDFPTSAEWNSLTTADEIDGFVPAAFTAAE